MSDAPPEPDLAWMDAALQEAAKGRPSPNPRVGCVIVKRDKVVALAHHERAGEDHAEVAALTAAGDKAKGASVYVTLEPCNHVGRTPPCTDALIRAGVARVVVGCEDPNPHVEGGGLDRLRDAGIEVRVGVREEQAARLIAPWSKFITTGLPHVAIKLGLSLDGRIASRSGASKWVTGPDARARVHALRAGVDAVAVGIGTALADNPRLTVRDSDGPSPTRIVFDTGLRLAHHLKLVETATEIPTWVVCGADAPRAAEEELTRRGVEVLRSAPSTEGRLEVLPALKLLGSKGIVTMMVEGGAELVGSFLATQTADELHAFVAPILLGPRGRPGAVDWAGPDSPANAPRIIDPEWELCGEDAHVFGVLGYPEAP